MRLAGIRSHAVGINSSWFDHRLIYICRHWFVVIKSNMSKDEDTSRNMEEHPSIPEDASVILSTLHGRMRRQERGIFKAAFEYSAGFLTLPTLHLIEHILFVTCRELRT